MTMLKKILALIMIMIIIPSILVESTRNNISASTNATTKKPVKVGAFFSTFDDEYLSLVKQNLEDIQKENEDKVQFTFYNAEGNIIVDTWKNNKKAIDKNNDNMLQYVLLHGETFNPAAVARTKYSIQTINNAGIRTDQLALKYCNWNRECARISIESLLLQYGNRIEAIIANNDDMALGAIEALQKQGYFKGDKSKYIPIVGVDAIPEARELIKEGFMTGTIIQDPRDAAEAIYTIGMNMASGNNPINGTNYKFDNTGVVVRLPYYEYKE